MTEFSHRVLTPFEVGRTRLMRPDYEFAMTLFRGWLLESTGAETTLLYPSRTCHGFTGDWTNQPFSFNDLGLPALPQETVDALAESSINAITPEPLTKIGYGGKTNQIGFGVEGKGQAFEALFYTGISRHPLKLPTPEGYWILKSATLTTPIS